MKRKHDGDTGSAGDVLLNHMSLDVSNICIDEITIESTKQRIIRAKKQIKKGTIVLRIPSSKTITSSVTTLQLLQSSCYPLTNKNYLPITDTALVLALISLPSTHPYIQILPESFDKELPVNWSHSTLSDLLKGSEGILKVRL
jgi:hypothetical protein